MNEETWYIKPLTIALYPALYLVTKNATQGAQTTLYVATSDAVNTTNAGEYWADCRVIRGKNKLQHNETAEDRLIEISKALVSKWL
jgi:hypothetical protein